MRSRSKESQGVVLVVYGGAGRGIPSAVSTTLVDIPWIYSITCP